MKLYFDTKQLNGFEQGVMKFVMPYFFKEKAIFGDDALIFEIRPCSFNKVIKSQRKKNMNHTPWHAQWHLCKHFATPMLKIGKCLFSRCIHVLVNVSGNLHNDPNLMLICRKETLSQLFQVKIQTQNYKLIYASQYGDFIRF